MRSLTLPFILVVLGISVSYCAASENLLLLEKTQTHTQWIEDILKEIGTIKVGMTRQELLNVFTTEGGISSRQQRTYFHKQCPYIKVDVTFKEVGPGVKQAPEDQILEISKPYLQLVVLD